MTDITADMIERACKAYHIGIYGYPCLITEMQRRGMEAAIREVLQLVEEAQTADTYTIKPLEWKKKFPDRDDELRIYTFPTTNRCLYGVSYDIDPMDHGCAYLTVDNILSDDPTGTYPTLEAAKSAAEAHWRDLLLDSVLEEV